MNQAELEVVLADIVTGVTDVGDKLTEGLGEVNTLIQQLRDEIANGTSQTTPAVDALIVTLQEKIAASLATATTLADIVVQPTP